MLHTYTSRTPLLYTSFFVAAWACNSPIAETGSASATDDTSTTETIPASTSTSLDSNGTTATTSDVNESTSVVTSEATGVMGSTTGGGSSASSMSSDTSESGDGTTTDVEKDPCAPDCLAGDCPDIVNVKMLGAVGDGQTDDYQALLAIAAYATEHPGVTLVYPEGTYRIDRLIVDAGPNANGVKHIVFSG